MSIPDDLKALMDPQKDNSPDKRPFYWLWVYDGQSDKVTLTHNEDRPPALHVTHKDLAKEAHPEYRIDGFAYSIRGGYRITDEDSKPIKDPYVKDRIKKALDEDVRRG